MASDELASKAVANGEGEALFDPGLKKKKNKKIVDFDLDATESTDTKEPVEENLDEMFGGLKKKSKKKKAIPADLVSVFFTLSIHLSSHCRRTPQNLQLMEQPPKPVQRLHKQSRMVI